MPGLLLSFRPIELPRDAALCVAHRADADACGDGNAARFYSEAGPGGERYLEILAPAICDLPGSCVHAVLDGRVVGQVEMMRDRNDATAGRVNLFYLVAAMRGRGLGGQLENYAVNFLRGQGFSRAWLRVASTNTQAMKFYLKHGWSDAGPDPRDPASLVMIKPLG
jgi:GNAT superfamily N-acetyltransferase